jgi:SanA protein
MVRFLTQYKYLFISLIIVCVVAVGVVFYANWLIDSYGARWTYNHIKDIPHNKVGLLLGTSKRMADGRTNLYFKYRIEAGVALWKAKKVDYLLLSGDNSLSYYNEPMDMKKALIAQGVPDSLIFLDYAGFRTLDSVVRGKKIFGQDRYTVISQAFHNKRAIYIARSYGIAAIGFNARDVSSYNGFKTNLREKFARVKVLLDLYLLHTQPKFLGEQIQIGK